MHSWCLLGRIYGHPHNIVCVHALMCSLPAPPTVPAERLLQQASMVCISPLNSLLSMFRASCEGSKCCLWGRLPGVTNSMHILCAACLLHNSTTSPYKHGWKGQGQFLTISPMLVPLSPGWPWGPYRMDGAHCESNGQLGHIWLCHL